MPGLESQDTTIGRIDPSTLIGRPDRTIVEPRATAALTDALRQGFITADDIIGRVGELGKAKDKAQLNMANAQSQQATESLTPEAQAARAAQTKAVQATSEQAVMAAEKQKIYDQYPGVKYYDLLGPKSGVLERPTLPDGSPDYKQMESVGVKLALHQAKQGAALDKLKNIDPHFDSSNNVVSSWTKQGDAVDINEVRRLQREATEPFSLQTSGTSTPVVEAKNYTGETGSATPEVRARLAATLDADAVVGLDDLSVARLDEAERAKAARAARPNISPAAISATPGENPPLGQPISGGGLSLGPKAPGAQKPPTEAQQRAQLALSRFGQSNDMLHSLREAGYDPTSIGSWMNGLLPEIIKSGDRKAYDSAVDAWSQGLLRLESGAAISRHEKTWYDKAFFPQVSDPPAVIASKDIMRANVERMVAEIAQQGGVVSPESKAQAQKIFQQAAANISSKSTSTAGEPAPIVSVPSGKKLQRDANGVYHYVQ